MGYVVMLEGKRTEVRLEGRRTLAEILSDTEYARVVEGSLVAFTANDRGIMSLDSPLEDGQTVILRPLQPEKDLAGFGVPNRAGKIVSFTEALDDVLDEALVEAMGLPGKGER